MLSLLLVGLALFDAPAEAARVKDLATVYGVRDNMLTGYGLVTGLNRTGDSKRSEATIRAIANRLQGLGFTVSTEEILARNVAVVLVTARLPSTVRPGQTVDVEVSSMGDATSLEGGILQLTPLLAPNGQTFASAQGPVIIGGFSAEAGGSSSRKNHPTVGRVTQGTIVERENPNRLDLDAQDNLDLLIKEPDFTTARRMADAINERFGDELAKARDNALVRVEVPERYKGRVVELLADLESVDVAVDNVARVVINERTGTVVMGSDVRISPVAIAHGGLQVEVSKNTSVSQPNALASGRTAVTSNSEVSAAEGEGRLVVVEGVSIGELVTALNNIGVKPRDLIQIMLAIKAAGALQADLEVM
jgi:flagellar P-ring protein FlgI